MPAGPKKRIGAVFLYHNSRESLVADIAAGRAPDTGLLGSNHLLSFDIDASLHAPRSRAGNRGNGIVHRITWNARELPVAWSLGDADVACSFWTKLFPLAARLRRRPAVVAFNIGLCTDYERSPRSARMMMSAALRSTRDIICFASAQRDRLLGQHRLDPARVHVAHLGVDEAFYQPRELPTDGYVLAVGRDMARDYSTLAQAVERLGAKTIIVASQRNLAGVKLPSNTELRLDVPFTELRELYAGASCVVLPTRHEGYPYGADCSGQTVLLDAMASARPVVASRRATLSDYVVESETALIVPPEDPEALAAALERVLGDRELATSMGAASRAAVENRFTTRHLAARLAPIIRGAAA